MGVDRDGRGGDRDAGGDGRGVDGTVAVDAVDAVGTGTLSLTRDAELAETWTAMADAKAKAILPWSKVAWVDTMWIGTGVAAQTGLKACLLYTSPSPRDRQKSRMDRQKSRMPSSA